MKSGNSARLDGDLTDAKLALGKVVQTLLSELKP